MKIEYVFYVMSGIPKDDNYSAVFDEIDSDTKFEITETKKTCRSDKKLLKQKTINTHDALNKITDILSSNKYKYCTVEVYDNYGFKVMCLCKIKKKNWFKRHFKKKYDIVSTVEYTFQKNSI